MPAVSSVESYNGRVSLAYFTAPLRRALRIGLLAQHLVWGVILAGLIFPLLNPAQRDRRNMAWARRLLRVLGVRLKADTAPRLPGGALLVCNHVSWLDIYLIYAAQRVHFISKAEVRSWPVAGGRARGAGARGGGRGRRAGAARGGAGRRARGGAGAG